MRLHFLTFLTIILPATFFLCCAHEYKQQMTLLSIAHWTPVDKELVDPRVMEISDSVMTSQRYDLNIFEKSVLEEASKSLYQITYTLPCIVFPDLSYHAYAGGIVMVSKQGYKVVRIDLLPRIDKLFFSEGLDSEIKRRSLLQPIKEDLIDSRVIEIADSIFTIKGYNKNLFKKEYFVCDEFFLAQYYRIPSDSIIYVDGVSIGEIAVTKSDHRVMDVRFW